MLAFLIPLSLQDVGWICLGLALLLTFLLAVRVAVGLGASIAAREEPPPGAIADDRPPAVLRR